MTETFAWDNQMIDLMRIIEKEFVLWYLNMILFTIFDNIEQWLFLSQESFSRPKFSFSESGWWKSENDYETIEHVLKSLLSWDSAHLKHQDPWSWIWNSLGFCSEDWLLQIFRSASHLWLCCKIFIDEWGREIMAIFFYQLLIPYDFSLMVCFLCLLYLLWMPCSLRSLCLL